MYYKRPTFKKEKVNGFAEGYKFEEVNTIDLTLETIAGGWDNIDVSKEDRVIYVLRGMGFAKIGSKSHRLDEGIVLEIPAGQEVEMNGQLQFLCVKARG